jgi:branched-chain amino acid transport system substrate-binding protein
VKTFSIFIGIILIVILIAAQWLVDVGATNPLNTSSTTTTPPYTPPSPPPPGGGGGGTIKLGIALPLSGAFAASAPYKTGVSEMIAKQINDAGGLLGGQQLEILTGDNAGDPSLMPHVLYQLKQQGCISIFGVIGGADLVDFQWATQFHIPVFGCNGDNIERTEEFSKFGFYVGPMDSGITRALAQYIIPQTDVKSMAMLAGDITLAHEVWDSLWPELARTRPDIRNLGATYVGVSESEIWAVIASAIAKKPDYFLCMLSGSNLVAFLQQANQFDLVSQMKIGGIYTLGSQTTGPFGVHYLVGMDSLDFMPFWLDTPAMKDFVAKHLAATKLYPDNLTAFFESWMLSITQAIKTAGSTDPDNLVAALEGMTFNASVGAIKIDEYDHQYEIPMFFSKSGYSTDFPIAIGLNSVKYQDGMYPTREEILAFRGSINVGVVLQGDARPAEGWAVPLTVKLFAHHTDVPVDVLTATPAYTFNLTTAKSGSTATAQALGIADGTYDISVVSPGCLTNVMRGIVINNVPFDINVGSLFEGNANDDNKISIQDFGILAAAYGKGTGETSYDTRADFDRSGRVDIADFGLLAANYARISPVVVP